MYHLNFVGIYQPASSKKFVTFLANKGNVKLGRFISLYNLVKWREIILFLISTFLLFFAI